MRALRALPAMMKLGAAQGMAYRAEFFIWMLTSTMPLIMLPLWYAVAEEAPIAGFGTSRFTAYFLAGFVVRQLVGAWASWTINYEVRSGALSQRLLKPIHPIWAYMTENLASIPLRGLLAVPAVVLVLAFVDTSHIARGVLTWLMVPLSLIGAWGIGFLVHVSIGALSLWMHQSIKVLDVWTALFFVLSGYLVPVALFPESLRWIPAWLPFVYQHGFPIDLITGVLSHREALRQLGAQWCWVAIMLMVATTLWRRGLRRYGAFGG